MKIHFTNFSPTFATDDQTEAQESTGIPIDVDGFIHVEIYQDATTVDEFRDGACWITDLYCPEQEDRSAGKSTPFGAAGRFDFAPTRRDDVIFEK